MKIGIITTSYPRYKHDHMGSFIYEAARAIQQKGYQVKVITMHSPGTARHENWDNIEILRTKYLPDFWELLKSEGGGLPEVWKKKSIVRLQIVPFLIAFFFDVLINTRDCDLLHANWTLAGAIAWVCGFITRKKYLVTVHGSDIYQSVKLPFITRLTRLSLSRAKKVLVVSKALADQVYSIGIPYSKIAIIPDGVDTAYFTPLSYNERKNNILFVGSLIERKGVRTLIQAFAAVVKQFPKVHLILIGEGAQRIEIEQLAQLLGISANITLTGAQPQERVAVEMRYAKVFVLPSIEEGLGVVLLEAIASGTPIVASNVGGISEVVDDTIGILVPPGDADQLGKAILTIINLSPEKWNYFHHNARKRAEGMYDWNHIAEQLMRFYID
jgi:glycosyltransferase involved in cell wall biosynthesis